MNPPPTPLPPAPARGLQSCARSVHPRTPLFGTSVQINTYRRDVQYQAQNSCMHVMVFSSNKSQVYTGSRTTSLRASSSQIVSVHPQRVACECLSNGYRLPAMGACEARKKILIDVQANKLTSWYRIGVRLRTDGCSLPSQAAVKDQDADACEFIACCTSPPYAIIIRSNCRG